MNRPYKKQFDMNGDPIVPQGTYTHFNPNRAARRKAKKLEAKKKK